MGGKMIDTITNDHKEIIQALFNEASQKIHIISPFLSTNMADLLCSAAENGIECTFITRFYLQDFLDGSNTLTGLQHMINSGVKVYILIGLHTKLYLIDDSDAIVGSANFTESGLNRNIELSILFNDEPVVKDLNDYFDEILKKISSSDDGLLTNDDILEYKKLYDKKKASGKNTIGGVEFNYKRKGAALDSKTRNLKTDDKLFHNEILNHINERNSDAVYGLFDGNKSEISYKTLSTILLKFSASAKRRYESSKEFVLDEFFDNDKKFYMTNFSISRKSSAMKVEDGDETFFCVHSYDEAGKPSPMIVGKGHLRAYKNNNDARLKNWFSQYDWLADYPLYCVINDAKIIKAPVKCGIPLREVIDALGCLTYENTRNKIDEYYKEEIYKAHRQQAVKRLTYEAKDYIDTILDELFGKYGATLYTSENE